MYLFSNILINTFFYNVNLLFIKYYKITIFIVIIILQQADNFCNSIGILQQCALPSKFSNFDRNGSQTPQQQEGVYWNGVK